MNFTETFLEKAYLRDANYQVLLSSEVAGNKDCSWIRPSQDCF